MIGARGEEHPTEGGRERDPACNAVDAVHEVVGVGETDDPEDGDDEADDAERKLPDERNGNGFEIAHAKHRGERDQSLHGKADSWAERMNVVSPAEVGNDRATDEVDEAMSEISLEGGDTSCREDDDHNSHTPTARSRCGMRTAFVGMVDDAATFGILTDDPHAEGGEDGEECEDEDGCHGGDSKLEMGSGLSMIENTTQQNLKPVQSSNVLD